MKPDDLPVAGQVRIERMNGAPGARVADATHGKKQVAGQDRHTDNRFTQHRAICDDRGQRRELWRTAIQGEVPA